jgi:hypothetical protein
VLPAKDVAGTHGKSAAFVGFDEIHAYRDWSLMEALQPDPTRIDTLQWITSRRCSAIAALRCMTTWRLARRARIRAVPAGSKCEAHAVEMLISFVMAD